MSTETCLRDLFKYLGKETFVYAKECVLAFFVYHLRVQFLFLLFTCKFCLLFFTCIHLPTTKFQEPSGGLPPPLTPRSRGGFTLSEHPLRIGGLRPPDPLELGRFAPGWMFRNSEGGRCPTDCGGSGEAAAPPSAHEIWYRFLPQSVGCTTVFYFFA